MKLFLVAFEALAALFVIGLLGFWIIRRRVVPGRALRFLSPLAIEIALPCLVFVRILRGLRPAEQPGWWLWPLAFLAFMAWAGLLTAACARFVRAARRREFAFALFFQNITFLPLVILTQIDGADSPLLVNLFLFGLLFSPVFFNTYYLFFARDGRGLRWGKTAHPVVLACVVAVGLCLLGVQGAVPAFLMSSLELLGNMAVPLLMLILGGNLYVQMQRRGELHAGDTAKFVLAKNILFPLATLGLLVLIRPPRAAALILFLESAVPPIASIPIFVEREGGDTAAAGRFVIASFAAALITIPALMALFEVCFPAP
ncbi:MAG: AEC family transporter [Planctomycetota bacterium]